jgi:hypothetical protein
MLFSALQIKENEMDGACGTYGNKRNANMKPEDKKQLGRPRRIWENNIKKDLKETGLEGVGWINLAQAGARGGPLSTC